MPSCTLLNRTLLSALVVVVALGAQAHAQTREDCERQFNPQTGQPGKDVVWVPTNDQLVNRMLKMAAVSPSDLVYDLGAGDGKIAIAAARDFRARSVGVEYNPELAKLAQCFAEADGVAERASIVQGDIFETDFSKATVVTLYLLPELNLRLRPTLLKMKPGTRVVSHSFLMDDWEPDDRSMTDDGHAYLWIVPAQAEGTWRFEREGGGDAFTLTLTQKFQELSGSVDDRNMSVDGKLNGDRVDLSFPEKGSTTQIAGRIQGKQMLVRVNRGGKTESYVGRRT